jgi:hypothetical protein
MARITHLAATRAGLHGGNTYPRMRPRPDDIFTPIGALRVVPVPFAGDHITRPQHGLRNARITGIVRGEQDGRMHPTVT